MAKAKPLAGGGAKGSARIEHGEVAWPKGSAKFVRARWAKQGRSMHAHVFGMAGTRRSDKGEDKARPRCSWPWRSHGEVKLGVHATCTWAGMADVTRGRDIVTGFMVQNGSAVSRLGLGAQNSEVVYGSWCPGRVSVRARAWNTGIPGPRRCNGLVVAQSKGQIKVEA
jgi:hypothetical protein